MTAIARRLAICTVALGTIALAACAGDPTSPKAGRSNEIFHGSETRLDTGHVDPSAVGK